MEFEGLPGRADGSSAYTWLGARTRVLVRWFPPVVLPSGPGPRAERFPRKSTK
jgi:hypothetical protein